MNMSTHTSTTPQQHTHVDSTPYINAAVPDSDELLDLRRIRTAGSVVTVTESIAIVVKTSLSHWQIIVFGQILALLMGLRGASTAFLYLECNVMAPTFQLWWIYLILSFNLVIHRNSGLGGGDDNFGGGDGRHASQISPASQNGGGDRRRASQIGVGGRRRSSQSVLFDLSALQQPHSRIQNNTTGINTNTTTYTLPGFTSIKLQTVWWKYLLLSILDLEGNYLTYLALKYTSLKSVSLLDTLAIPTAMLASYTCLRKCYSGEHLTGAFICLAGAAVMVFADYLEEKKEDESYESNDDYNSPDYYYDTGFYDNDVVASSGMAVRGDILAATGGIFWGLKDTMSEGVLQTSSQTEFLGMLGLFGFLLSSLQVAVLETAAVRDFFTGFSGDGADANGGTCSAGETYGLFFATIVIFVLYYLGIARFLNVSEAALLQLSLLAADLYAVLFSIIEEHKLPTWMFGLSMILILFGVLVYESSPEEEEEVVPSDDRDTDKFELPSSSYISPSWAIPDEPAQRNGTDAV
jgi:solute carrier family 35 protein F1/2